MFTYTKFKKLGIDLSPVGIDSHTENIRYFCTPIGMRFLGWAGVDGIHYGFVRGCGEMVFAVNPTNFGGEYVHPIAENFEDFLRLLIACGDCAALEQAWQWDKIQFTEFLQKYPPEESQRVVMSEIAEKTGLNAMENVWEYLFFVRNNFDNSKLQFRDEYYETLGVDKPVAEKKEWLVYYGDGYGCLRKKEMPGEKIVLDTCFFWGKEIWFVPAIYICSKGLVIDYCVELESWKQVSNVDFRSFFTLNGKLLQESCSSGECWIPEHCLVEGTENSENARQIIEYYGLDASRAWVFRRVSCPWATSRKPKEICSLEVKLVREMEQISGKTFRDPTVGDVIKFRHPVSGVVHRLTVKAYEQQELPKNTFADSEYEFPRHSTEMRYTVEPSLTRKHFSVRDCVASDEPKRRKTEKEGDFVSTIAIIGGVSGPATVMSAVGETEILYAATSALHFEATPEIEWKMEFHEKMMEDVNVVLIR